MVFAAENRGQIRQRMQRDQLERRRADIVQMHGCTFLVADKLNALEQLSCAVIVRGM